MYVLLQFHEFFFSLFYNFSVCYSKKSSRQLSNQFLTLISKKYRQLTIQWSNISILANIKLKIILNCWQQVTDVIRLSYSRSIYQIKPNFSAKMQNLFTSDGQKCGKNKSDSITSIKLIENHQNGEFKCEIVIRKRLKVQIVWFNSELFRYPSVSICYS